MPTPVAHRKMDAWRPDTSCTLRREGGCAAPIMHCPPVTTSSANVSSSANVLFIINCSGSALPVLLAWSFSATPSACKLPAKATFCSSRRAALYQRKALYDYLFPQYSRKSAPNRLCRAGADSRSCLLTDDLQVVKRLNALAETCG